MELSNLLKQKRQTLFSIFLVFLLLGTIFTLSQDFKFGAKSQILVIQEGYGRVDPFAVSRSVEYLSDLFSRVVYSNSFFSLVLDSGLDIDRNYFGEDSTKQMKKWKKTVSAKSVENSGIINISIYHPDAYQAKQIALAVNSVLINKNQNYQGLGDSVKISVLDQPVISKYPVKPNLIFNALFLIGLSLFFGLVYIYIFPEEEYNLSLFRKKKKGDMSSKGKGRGVIMKSEIINKTETAANNEESDTDIGSHGSIDNILE